MIRLIDTKESFFALREAWNALLSMMEGPCIFLTWEWMYTWWEYYISEDSSCRLFILLVSEDNGELTGIFPGFLKECRGIPGIRHTKLGFLGSETEAPDHLDLIAGPSKKRAVINEVFGYLREHATEIDLVELADMDEDSDSADLLLEAARHFNCSATKRIASTCPYLTLPSDYETYLASLSSKFRFNLKRYTRMLIEKEGVRFEEVREKGEVRDMVDNLFSLHKKRWQKDIGKTTFYSAEKIEFHSRLAEVFHNSSFLRLFFLAVDAEVIACLYCFEYGDKVYYYQSGFDPAWAQKSVGVVLIGKVVERCIAEKKSELDFLRGNEDYKLKWTSDARQTCHIAIGLTFRGKLIVFSRKAVRHLKTALKKFSFGYRLYKKLVKSD